MLLTLFFWPRLKIVVSVGSPSGDLGSAAMRKPLERAACDRKAGGEQGAATPSLRAELPLQHWYPRDGPDHPFGLLVLSISPLLLTETHQASQPGESCNHVCQCNHLPDFFHINLLKTVINSTQLFALLLHMGEKYCSN